MFTCEICGEEGFSEPDIKTHLLINHFENEMSCPFCCLSGVTYDELEFHINVAHSEENSEAADSSEYPTKELIPQTVGTVHSSTSSHLEMDVDALEGVASSGETDEVLCTGSLGSHEELNAGTAVSTVPKARPPAPSQGSSQTVKVKQVPAQDRDGQRESVTDYREPKKPEPWVSGRTAKHGTQSSQFPGQQDASNDNFEEHVKPKQKRLVSPTKGISTEKMYACPMCALVCRDCYILQEHVELHLQESMAEEKTSHSNQQLVRSPQEAEEKRRPDVNLQGIHVLDNNASSKQPVKNVEKLVSPMIDKASPPSVKANASGAPARKLYQCPMCALISTNSNVLQEHVELHLMENSMTAADNSHSDLLLAKTLQEEEEKQRRAEEAGREAEEFRKLQNQFGLDNSGGYKQQHIRNMERAVARGQMVPAEFHRRKAEMMESLALGVDDGRTKTSGVIGALYGYYQRDGRDVARVWLCAETDHFHSSGGDKGWGCGYRNFQMLVSSLLKMDQYKDCFKDKTVPCIPKVQALIEDAWKEGADPQGASHFNRKLQGTHAWIGATEIYSMLISLRVKSRILDFHCPTGPSDTHPRLFQWVRDYYSTAMGRGERLPPRVVQTASPPIYLQHQGHSRTIIGIEERKNGNLCLLIFDPGCPSQELQKLLQPDLSGARLKHLRKLPSALKHKQYQIVAVEGTLSQEEKHVRLQNSRILQAEKIP